MNITKSGRTVQKRLTVIILGVGKGDIRLFSCYLSSLTDTYKITVRLGRRVVYYYYNPL